jgi:hypothetical protein
MKLKSLLLAATLAFSSAAALAAPVPTYIDVTVTGSGPTWTAEYGASHTAGDFIDVYTFLPSSVTGLTDISFYNFARSTAFNITFTGAELSGVPIPYTNSGGVGFSFGGLIADFTGPLVLTISGTSGATGSYAGTLNVSAVPEPETYAMMLGGLGLLGFMARRRKQQG